MLSHPWMQGRLHPCATAVLGTQMNETEAALGPLGFPPEPQEPGPLLQEMGRFADCSSGAHTVSGLAGLPFSQPHVKIPRAEHAVGV